MKAIKISLLYENYEVTEAIIKNADLKIPCYHAECNGNYENPFPVENGVISIHIHYNKPDLIHLVLKRKNACLTRADSLIIIEKFPSINREIINNVPIVKVSYKIKRNPIIIKIEDDSVSRDGKNPLQHMKYCFIRRRMRMLLDKTLDNY